MRRHLTTVLAAVLVCAVAAGLYAVAGPRWCHSSERELLRALGDAGGVKLKGRRPALIELNLFGESCDGRFRTDDPARTLTRFAAELRRRGWRLREVSASGLSGNHAQGGWIDIGHYYPEDFWDDDENWEEGSDPAPIRPEGFYINMYVP